jgi:hypothetical protein
LGLSVLDSRLVLLCPEFRNLNLNGLVDAALQLPAVAELEEKLQPDKQRGQEDCLDDVVEQGGGSAFEGAVAEELEQPADDMCRNGDLVRPVRVLDNRLVGGGRCSQTDHAQHGTGYWFKQYVQDCICEGGESAEVEVKIWYRQGVGQWDESTGVGGLQRRGGLSI